MKVLELYSGIGGMHFALNESGVPGIIKAAVEINNIANAVYKHNFPDTLVINSNIESLTAEKINKLDVDTILMSPPCQPFTRNGLKNDIKDPRTDSFQHILDLLPDLNIKMILMENVKGFEESKMRTHFINSLVKCEFIYQEFLINPTQIGVPNSRPRYYCLAKKTPDKFNFETGLLLHNFPLPCEEVQCFEVANILEEVVNVNEFSVPLTLLKKNVKTLDVCYRSSRHTCCFTKSYGRYIKGCGSVLSECDESEAKKSLEILQECSQDSDVFLLLSENLNLRFFTPREICRLMCFPETFNFPTDINIRQQYKVLGNSINIKVVSKLIKVLYTLFLTFHCIKINNRITNHSP
ncbi:tRNA (cytosine(38)-C(5))-methyltransferase [Cylas formicarius]|uniref:tRNA (cytosine(38)-C(5))-methyltransferase n=1 Tax=Cylas formicarius TaxID=197179 RepID=UPI002958657F|nr:tRNA (cytosine(38)-C(5))-methyltransferase [Cylas formicarius]